MTKNIPIYHGIFFDKNAIAAAKEQLGIDAPSLPNVIANPHATFGFRVRPIDGFDEINEEANIAIIGYGNDGGNEGFLVRINSEIARFYQGQVAGRDENGNIYAHITISYDRASGRRPVDTGSISFEMNETEPVYIAGRFGYFDGSHIRYC